MEEIQSTISVDQELIDVLSNQKILKNHPQWYPLIEIVTGETNVSSAGYPYISDKSFRLFIQEVPHLFQDGQSILAWLKYLDIVLNGLKNVPDCKVQSVKRAVNVIRTVVLTAGVTAPPDLWLLKQVLSTHKELGILDWLLTEKALEPEEFSKIHKINLEQLKIDLEFLYSRGLLQKGDGDFSISQPGSVSNTLKSIQWLPKVDGDLFSKIKSWLSGEVKSKKNEIFLRNWLKFEADISSTNSWIANHFQIELGYRLLPIVLALKVLELTYSLKEGTVLEEEISGILPEMKEIFSEAGYMENGKITQLGARVFQRGPGPFGIIYAYNPYINQLRDILKSKVVTTWVNRAANVSASQGANSKNFQLANNALDQFCQDCGFKFTVFIEHAVGLGEATRQRFLKSGEKEIRYFGADLEDAAINKAIEQQELGYLPKNMEFIRSADIGNPAKVIQFLKGNELLNEPIVMMVGNGFHEIREQTNEKMVNVFRKYQEANFILIFTEESALHDEALLHTAWNTYHAGFRYVHKISGQGLRPAWEREESPGRWSWRKCASVGGFIILDTYSYRSRTIYPHKRPKNKNPSISETYFCVPQKLSKHLMIS